MKRSCLGHLSEYLFIFPIYYNHSNEGNYMSAGGIIEYIKTVLIFLFIQNPDSSPNHGSIVPSSAFLDEHVAFPRSDKMVCQSLWTHPRYTHSMRTMFVLQLIPTDLVHVPNQGYSQLLCIHCHTHTELHYEGSLHCADRPMVPSLSPWQTTQVVCPMRSTIARGLVNRAHCRAHGWSTRGRGGVPSLWCCVGTS